MDIRDTLLLVTSKSEDRSEFRALFERKYNILEAENGEQGLMLLEQNQRYIVAVLLETTLSGMSGWDLMREIRKRDLLPQIPVVILIPDYNDDSEGHAFELGASDVVLGKYDHHVIFHRVENIVELNRYKWHLEKTVKEQTDILRHSNDIMVDALSSLIEYRSVESGQHILRIRRFTQILMTEIARSCPEYKLNEETVDIVSSASALHDIGKIAIPDSILNKPGRLTDEERRIMEGHSLTGSRILEGLSGMGNEEYLRYAHNICHYHHERWDGNGYPEGIKGDEIPICAQVVGLADAYDALTTKRVYKDAYGHETAVNMILQGQCGVFSPKVLECFKQVRAQFADLAKKYADGRPPTADKINVPLPGPEISDSVDTLQAIQMKYHTMLHYIDATVVEIAVDEGVYHLVYNPYPELALIESDNSFEEGIRRLISQYIPSEQQGKTLRFFFDNIRKFLEENLRKQQYTYSAYSNAKGRECQYEVTFLRLGNATSQRRRMILIWRRLEEGESERSSESKLLPEGIGLEGICRFCHDRWLTLDGSTADLAKLLGYTEGELKIRFQNHMYELMAPEEQKTIQERLDSQLLSGKDVELEIRMIHKNGSSVWIMYKGRMYMGEDGREYLWGKLIDVTKTHHRQGILQEELDRCKILLDQVEHVTFDWDMIEDRMQHSERWQTMFGYVPMCENFGKNIRKSHLHPEDMEQFIQVMNNMRRGVPKNEIKMRLAKADGRYLWVRFRATTLFDGDGRPVRAIGVILNIDDTERANQALQERAERDGLTGLLNKKAGQLRVEKLLENGKKGERYAMLIIDLDNFKYVNDHYGHMFGDAILTQAAQEIRKQFRMDDIAARIGGDEFMVFMRKVPDKERVAKRCKKLVDSFQAMFEERIPGAGLTCSVGIAMSPDQGMSYQELYVAADRGLYQAKRLGKNQFAFYNEEEELPVQLTRANTRIDSDDEHALTEQNLINYTFQRLYRSDNMEEAINSILKVVGKQMNVSRVYIFENDKTNTYCSNTFEWCNVGITPEIQNLQNISYITDIPGYEESFDERGVFYCPDVREMPQEQFEIVDAQGIKSMLQCAIREKGVFRGYVGFDECVENRLWTQEQIDTLTFLSEVLSTFLLKQRAQEEIEQTEKDLRSILDNQDAWIYVIDPTNFELKYINRYTSKNVSNVEIGMKCYKSLRNMEQPCHDCPIIGLGDKLSKNEVILNSYLNVRVQAEATRIHWKGEQACLLTCREIKEQF